MGILLDHFACFFLRLIVVFFVHRNSNGFPRFQIEKCRRRFSIIENPQRPLSRLTTRHSQNGIGGTAVGLDKSHEFLPVLSFRIINPDSLETQ